VDHQPQDGKQLLWSWKFGIALCLIALGVFLFYEGLGDDYSGSDLTSFGGALHCCRWHYLLHRPSYPAFRASYPAYRA